MPNTKLQLFGLLPLLLGGLSVLAAGCGPTVEHTAADRVAAQLPALLGPAKHYDVHVQTDALEVARGKVRGVEIYGQDVALGPNLVVSSLAAQVEDIHFDPHTQKVTSLSAIPFEAVLTNDELQTYLSSVRIKSPLKLDDLQIRTEDGRLKLTFGVRRFGLRVPCTLEGNLEPESANPVLLDFVPRSASASIIPIPGPVLGMAFSHLNPVVSLATMRVPVILTQTTASGSDLTIDGVVTITPQMLSN